MGKTCDLSNFDRGMIVGARLAGRSVTETAKLLGFSRSAVARVYRECCEKPKTSNKQHFCGQKPLVNEKDERSKSPTKETSEQNIDDKIPGVSIQPPKNPPES